MAGASSTVIPVFSDVILAACCFPSSSSSSSFPSPALGSGRLDVAKAYYCPHRSQIEVWIAHKSHETRNIVEFNLVRSRHTPAIYSQVVYIFSNFPKLLILCLATTSVYKFDLKMWLNFTNLMSLTGFWITKVVAVICQTTGQFLPVVFRR